MITNRKNSAAGLSRRSFLRNSGLGLTMLATGGVSTLISGCSLTQPSAQGFRWLKPGDLPFLRAVAESVLRDSIEPDQDSLNSYLLHLDSTLTGLHPVSRQELLDLMSLVTSPIKGAVTGVWKPWEEASSNQIDTFLDGWKNSRITLFNKAYSSLVNLLILKRFMQEDAWQNTGYPGPPFQELLVTATNNY